MKIVPLRGRFDSKEGLLANLLEDDTVENLVVVSIHKNGSYHIQSTSEMLTSQLSYAATIIQYEIFDVFQREDRA